MKLLLILAVVGAIVGKCFIRWYCGGGRMVRRYHVSCVSEASNWYWAYSCAKPTILVVGKGRGRGGGGGVFFISSVSSLSFLFLFLSCSYLSSLLLSLQSLFPLSLGDDTKWPTRVDVSLNPNTINQSLILRFIARFKTLFGKKGRKKEGKSDAQKSLSKCYYSLPETKLRHIEEGDSDSWFININDQGTYYNWWELYESAHDKTNKMPCAPSEDSDQPGHPPSLIRVFTVRMKIASVLSYSLSGQRRLWSDCADAQADLSLRWVHMAFCWFCHALTNVFPY